MKFADDTKIFSRIIDDNDWHTLQDDLSKLITWSEKWQMLFNTSKCKVMHIDKSHEKGDLLHEQSAVGRSRSRERFGNLS